MMHANSWEWRKNIAHVGTHCEHGTWWSQDCPRCHEAHEKS